MKHVSNYSKEALDDKCNSAHEVKRYSRYTEYGVTKIYYYIDITTTQAVLSGLFVIPGLFYLGDQAFNDGQLCTGEDTLYFDEASGDEISSAKAEENRRKNRQADELGQRGNELWSQGKYREALEKFRQAYLKCTNGYSQEASFKSKRDKAETEAQAADWNAEGNRLFRQEKFGEAEQKYRLAYDHSKEPNARRTYASNRETAARRAEEQLKNQLAEQLNREGNGLFNGRRYGEAYDKYNQAYILCTSGYSQEDEFKNNRDSAQREMKAADLNAEGDRFFSQGYFDKAKDKYQQAYNKSQVAIEENIYKRNIEVALKRADEQLKNRQADQLNREGNLLINQKQYRAAHVKYNQAYSKCTSDYSEKAKFKQNRDVAKNEAEAADLNSEGDRLFAQGKFSDAQSKYQRAYDTSQIGGQCEQYWSNKEKARLEEELVKNKQADQLHQEGAALFNGQGQYKEAYDKFNQAWNTCTSNYSEKNRFAKSRDAARREMDAASLNNEGDALYRQSKFSDALEKYQQAYDTSIIDFERNKYKTNRDDAVEAEHKRKAADALFKEGNELLNQAQYREAYEKLDRACSTCTSGYARIETFRIKRDEASREMKAANFNDEGNALFGQGNFNEAQNKYQQAYDSCQVRTQYLKYKANVARCKTELQAKALCDEGDKLFVQHKYADAQAKYQKAHHKSSVESERVAYKIKQAKCLRMMAEKTWNDAWFAENSDHSKVAVGKFQETTSLLRKALQLAPTDGKLLALSNACSLKMDGNALFNEGIKSQQDGIQLLEQAKQLKRQQRYEEAKSKLKQAERQLLHAMENFQRGTEYDQRFVSCVELAKQQIEDVGESIGTIDRQATNRKFEALQLSGDRCEESKFPPIVNGIAGKQYHAQI
ncbi:uncharacterized protein LOC128732817 isoform X1 [Sabethes cyaneus]|uniref:uncharacterized protein LOC128732817 isoform X1 n=1 Tax=Sabethes cyaneus TaxID=53552 RepID=UPI00237E3BFD|nr:uncharacterized protein LOC128732817 isoform X1 [Sabethes cyaneus]